MFRNVRILGRVPLPELGRRSHPHVRTCRALPVGSSRVHDRSDPHWPGPVHRHGHRVERTGEGKHGVRRRARGLQQPVPGLLLQRVRLRLHHGASALVRTGRQRRAGNHRADRRKRADLPGHSLLRRHGDAPDPAAAQGTAVVRIDLHPPHQPRHPGRRCSSPSWSCSA